MPTPELKVVTATSLSASWRTPTVQEARGKILHYNVFYLEKTDPEVSPFAPPYIWKVITSTLNIKGLLHIEMRNGNWKLFYMHSNGGGHHAKLKCMNWEVIMK